MNVEIDEEIKAIEVLIRNHEWNDEVQELMERLKERKRPYFVGKKEEMQHVFRSEEIICLVHRARFHNGAEKTGNFRNERKVI